MTQAEHAAFRFAGSVGKEGTQGGSLERHHVVPIREGGAVSHPSNLYTLCFFCHREWHKFWELPAGRVTGGTVSAALLIEGLRKKPIEHLRNDCARQGVDARGNRLDLVARLAAHLTIAPAHDADDADANGDCETAATSAPAAEANAAEALGAAAALEVAIAAVRVEEAVEEVEEVEEAVEAPAPAMEEAAAAKGAGAGAAETVVQPGAPPPPPGWTAFLAATPFRLVVVCTRPNLATVIQPPGSCCRCGVSAERCEQLRPGRHALPAFERRPGQPPDWKKPMCYWCQREWTVFWLQLRPSVHDFMRATPFRPVAW